MITIMMNEEVIFVLFCKPNLFGGEANWGLISGWETAKLEIMKLSSEGEQLEKKKEDYEVMNIDPGR